MNTTNINGKVYRGNSVNIINGKVFIDGVEATPDGKEINIAINGPVSTLTVDVCSKVAVIGNVGQIKTASGDVEVRGDITGSVQTMSGDVSANHINGAVSTMSGDISRK